MKHKIKILLSLSILLVGSITYATTAQSNANNWNVQNLVAFVSGDLNQMWSAKFAERGIAYRQPNAVVAYYGRTRTPCGVVRTRTALYCSASHSIYYDIVFMNSVLNQIGDFGVAAVIAHEWGHAAQVQMGLSGISSINNELMADCMAGAYANYADSTGVLEDGDYEEGRDLFSRLGDPPNTHASDEGAHGTATQRVEAYDQGYASGIDTCI